MSNRKEPRKKKPRQKGEKNDGTTLTIGVVEEGDQSHHAQQKKTVEEHT